MSAEIIVNSGSDKAITLGFQQMARTLSVGSTWNDLRIVMRFRFENTLTVKANQLFFGIQAGTTNFLYDPAGPTQAFGVYNQGGNWAYNAGPPDYFTGGTNLYCFYRRGTTFTQPIFFANVGSHRLAANTTHALIGFRINKTTPTNTTFGILYHDSTTVTPPDATQTDFINALDGTSIPANYNFNSNLTAGGPHNVDEATYGGLDSIFVTHRGAANRIIITDIGADVVS